MSRRFHVITATSSNHGIGKDGMLPWGRLPKDMEYFSRVTSQVDDCTKRNAVIMGRRTWISINSSPLPNRLNIIVGRFLPKFVNAKNTVKTVTSLDEALDIAFGDEEIEKVWVIGGEYMYEKALRHPQCELVYLTEIQRKYECDTFFPFKIVEESFEFIQSSDLEIDNGVGLFFKLYCNKKYSKQYETIRKEAALKAVTLDNNCSRRTNWFYMKNV